MTHLFDTVERLIYVDVICNRSFDGRWMDSIHKGKSKTKRKNTKSNLTKCNIKIECYKKNNNNHFHLDYCYYWYYYLSEIVQYRWSGKGTKWQMKLFSRYMDTCLEWEKTKKRIIEKDWMCLNAPTWRIVTIIYILCLYFMYVACVYNVYVRQGDCLSVCWVHFGIFTHIQSAYWTFKKKLITLHIGILIYWCAYISHFVWQHHQNW